MKRNIAKVLLVIFFPVTIVCLFCAMIWMVADVILADLGWRKS